MKPRNAPIFAVLVAATTFVLAAPAFAAGGGGVVSADPSKHFDPKGKEPSKFTIELQNGQRATLPFADKRDFDEAKKGFIAAPPYKQIMAEAGNVAWDMESYEGLSKGQEFRHHPALAAASGHPETRNGISPV